MNPDLKEAMERLEKFMRGAHGQVRPADLRLVLDTLREMLDPAGVAIEKFERLTPEQQEEHQNRMLAWIENLKYQYKENTQ